MIAELEAHGGYAEVLLDHEPSGMEAGIDHRLHKRRPGGGSSVRPQDRLDDKFKFASAGLLRLAIIWAGRIIVATRAETRCFLTIGARKSWLHLGVDGRVGPPHNGRNARRQGANCDLNLRILCHRSGKRTCVPIMQRFDVRQTYLIETENT